MIDIVSIGNQKVAYQDHKNVDFEPLSFYLNLAQKTIAKFGSNFSSGIRTEMLQSEDAIANVANCLMMADWRWDKDRKGDTGQQKTKYSYRNQCAIWAIKSYLTRKSYKKHRVVDAYIDNNMSSKDSKSLCILDLIVSPEGDPMHIMMQQEEHSNLQSYLSKILSIDANLLTERQSEYIKLYFFEDLTFAEIGKKFNITREAVRQGIKKALTKIREMSNDTQH